MSKGRKRKVIAPRKPGGRVRQPPESVKAKEAREVGYSARERVLGISRTKAVEKEAGYAIGRAYLRGEISAAQREAAETYEEAYRAYRAAISAPAPGASASDYDRMGGHDGAEGDDPDYTSRCNAARRRFGDIRRAVAEADPLAQMAMDGWILEDKEMIGCIGELRAGLNAVARLTQQRKAA